MRLRTTLAVTLLIGWLVLPGPAASAQVVVRPFIDRGVTAFDPEISTVSSGTLQDAQAAVSHDRKYVTMTMQPQVSQLVALQTFNFQASGNGFVGVPAQDPNPQAGNGATPNPRQPAGAQANRTANAPASLPQPKASADNLLTRPGMTRLAGAP